MKFNIILVLAFMVVFYSCSNQQKGKGLYTAEVVGKFQETTKAKKQTDDSTPVSKCAYKATFQIDGYIQYVSSFAVAGFFTIEKAENAKEVVTFKDVTLHGAPSAPIDQKSINFNYAERKLEAEFYSVLTKDAIHTAGVTSVEDDINMIVKAQNIIFTEDFKAFTGSFFFLMIASGSGDSSYKLVDMLNKLGASQSSKIAGKYVEGTLPKDCAAK